MTATDSVRTSVIERSAWLWQFSLKSMLLAVLLLAFCLGLFQITLLVGAMFIAVSAPAVWRTVRISRRAAADGKALNMLAQAGVFLRSLQIVSVLLLAAVGAVLCGGLSALLALGVGAVELVVRFAVWLQRGAEGANRLRRILFRATKTCASANVGWLRRYCAT